MLVNLFNIIRSNWQQMLRSTYRYDSDVVLFIVNEYRVSGPSAIFILQTYGSLDNLMEHFDR